MNKTFEFDVAISFLSEDENIASKISDELSKNFNVFFFPNNQRDIAGKDGVDTFSEVFLKKSRLNIVLFRQKWGKTDWTRVEETAIKSRIFNGDEWDSLFFLKLEDADNPNWIPPQYIYASIDRYSLDELIAIIKFRIQERGGHFNEESIVEMAQRVQKEQSLKKYIDEYLESENALIEVKKEVNELLKIFESQYIKLKKSSPDLPIGKMEKNDGHYHFPITGTYLHFKWSQYFSNSLDNSKLQIILYPQKNNPKEICYQFTMNKDKQIGWSNTKFHEFINSKKLVEYWMKKHLELAIDNREKGLS